MNLTMHKLHGMSFAHYARIIGERVQNSVRQSAYLRSFAVDALNNIDRAQT